MKLRIRALTASFLPGSPESGAAGRVLVPVGWGEHPIAARRFGVDAHTMKARRKGKALTLGEFIVAVYDVCGKRRAEGVIRLAAQAHLIALPGQRYFTVS